MAGVAEEKESPKLDRLDDATCAFLGKTAADKASWMAFASDMKKETAPLTP
ncbi:hypothetical protein D3C83_237160 [compost metagenome]